MIINIENFMDDRNPNSTPKIAGRVRDFRRKAKWPTSRI